MKTQIFDKMEYDLKGHPRVYKTTVMPKSFKHIRLWTDFDENLYDLLRPSNINAQLFSLFLLYFLKKILTI